MFIHSSSFFQPMHFQWRSERISEAFLYHIDFYKLFFQLNKTSEFRLLTLLSLLSTQEFVSLVIHVLKDNCPSQLQITLRFLKTQIYIFFKAVIFQKANWWCFWFDFFLVFWEFWAFLEFVTIQKSTHWFDMNSFHMDSFCLSNKSWEPILNYPMPWNLPSYFLIKEFYSDLTVRILRFYQAFVDGRALVDGLFGHRGTF